MSWLEQMVTETAQTFREALGSWQRTGQLCILILTLAVAGAIVLWVSGR